MNKRWLLNLSLLGATVILAALAVWRPGIDQPVALPPLTTIKAGQIKRIAIKRNKTDTIELELFNSDWRMAKPVSGRANVYMVNDVLRILSAKNQQSLPAVAIEQLDRYGLGKPTTTLRLDQLEIRFGNTNPVNSLRYVMLQQQVAMIDNRYYQFASRSHADFFSKRLIEKDREPIALSLPGTRLSQENGTWQVYPKKEGLSADRIKDLVDQWRYAHALAVKTYDKRPALDWVRLSFKDDKKQLRIGVLSRSPEFILYRPDEKLQYHFPEDVGKRLLHLAP